MLKFTLLAVKMLRTNLSVKLQGKEELCGTLVLFPIVQSKGESDKFETSECDSVFFSCVI
jgi:hypothetical protein